TQSVLGQFGHGLVPEVVKPESVKRTFQVLDVGVALLILADSRWPLNRAAGWTLYGTGEAAPSRPPVLHRPRGVKMAMLTRRQDEMLEVAATAFLGSVA